MTESRLLVLRGIVVAALLAGCTIPSSQSNDQRAGSAAPAGASAGAAVTSVPVPSAAASDAPSPSPSAVLTAAPTSLPTPIPSKQPTPKPSPTLNWAAAGCTAAVRSPVDLGEQARVTLKCPVGPTCTLKVKYPNGSYASLPQPTHPEPGWWRWSWTVPKSAHAGTANGTSKCTYAGDPHTGSIVIKLVDASLPGGYAIDVVNPEPMAWNAPGPLNMTVKVKGTVPADPTYGVTLTCQIDLWSYNHMWVLSDYTNAMQYVNGSGSLTASFRLEPPMTADFVGTGTWTVKCRNTHVFGDAWKADTGTIVITAAP